jgi:hypothetical protein
MSAQTSPNERFYRDLAHWRGQFEAVLRNPSHHARVWAETLGGGHSEALYPLGSAAERFVVSYGGGDDGRVGTLMYQRRHGRHTFVQWQVPLVPSKKGTYVKGTVRAMLQQEGYGLRPSIKLTPAMRRKLSSTKQLVSYAAHPMNGWYSCIVKSNGTRTPHRRSDEEFFIPIDEKKLLRQRRSQ